MSQAAELLTPDGEQLLAWLTGHEVSPDQALRLAEELRGRYPASLIAAALTQQSLRIAARAKFSRADAMLFTRAGLEQASSELTGAHGARRFQGFDVVADLCCGIGGNLTALANVAGHVLAVDSDLPTLRLATRNVAVYGAADRVTAVCCDVRDLALGKGAARYVHGAPPESQPDAPLSLPGAPPAHASVRHRFVQAVFIDPARRTGDRRLRAPDSRPALDWCFGMAERVGAVGIKSAPGLPHERVPAGWETEFVAVGRELKEALLWSPALATTDRRATILPGGDTLVTDPGPPVHVAEPDQFLLDPNPAVTRAGLVAELARHVGAWQIDPRIAFLATDREVSTPFARTLWVLESMPWHERQVARRLRELGIGSADIRRRGLAGDVRQIQHRLRLAGDKNATIVLTRYRDKPWALICAASSQLKPMGP